MMMILMMILRMLLSVLPTLQADELIKTGQLKGSTGTMKVEKVTEADLVKMEMSSQHGLDECSVRVQNVPAGMGEDEMAHFFRNFDVKVKGGIKEVERYVG